jgi:putative drug exporter of the RND superfamily
VRVGYQLGVPELAAAAGTPLVEGEYPLSVLLYRVGKFAYGKPWYVISGWLAVIAAVAGLLILNPVRLSNEVRIDGTPSQEVVDDLARTMPEASGGQGVLAFRAAEGSRIDGPEERRALLSAINAVYAHKHVVDSRKALAAELRKGDASALVRANKALARATAAESGTGADGRTAGEREPVPLTVDGQQVPGVYVSADGSVALMQFQFDSQTYELPTGTIDSTVDAAKKPTEPVGISVLPAASMVEIPEIVGVGEIIGVAVAALVLLITLGSVVAAGLPLVIALAGVAVGVGGAFTLSSIIEMHSLTAVLALMLGLAVGIDYALFIVNRERRLILDDGTDAHEATGRAVGTAGSAVFFAGATVIIALAGLLVAGITLLTTMALVAAATIMIAVLLALTLLPALLGVVGERICSAKVRAGATRPDAGSAPVNRWAAGLVRYRFLALAGAFVIPVVLALPAADMKLGLPSGDGYNSDTPQRQSYEAVSDTFGPGYNGPLLVVVRNTDTGRPIASGSLVKVYRELRAMDGVTAVSLSGTDSAGGTALFSLVPTGGPNDEETKDVVQDVRDRAPAMRDELGVSLGIAGFTALAIDVSDRLADALPLYIGTVFGLSLIVLLLVFRSLMIPVLATVGFLLSLTATLGVTTAVFQWGWIQSLLAIDATGPVVSLLPIIVTGVLYGLAMDYQMFLGTSIREAHVHGAAPLDAVVSGFGQAGRVVVAAAVIMISVFTGFVFNPEPMIKQVGFALAAGILIDAFLVRMTLVPAVMAIARSTAWWLPRWLDRLLPDLDVEGDQLLRRINATTGPDGAAAGELADAGTGGAAGRHRGR